MNPQNSLYSGNQTFCLFFKLKKIISVACASDYQDHPFGGAASLGLNDNSDNSFIKNPL